MKEFESVVTIQFTKITQIDEASQDYKDVMDDYKASQEAIENYIKACFPNKDDVRVKVQFFIRNMGEHNEQSSKSSYQGASRAAARAAAA